MAISKPVLENNLYIKLILKKLRLANVNCLICAQLNINSIRNKFESLKKIVSTNVDILLVCGTKLDLSFPKAQFHIHGFGEPYRFDRNGKGGGILLYIRDNIPSKLTESKIFLIIKVISNQLKDQRHGILYPAILNYYNL